VARPGVGTFEFFLIPIPPNPDFFEKIQSRSRPIPIFSKISIPIPPDPDVFKIFNPDPEFIPIPILKLHSLPLKFNTKSEKMLHLRVIGISHYFSRRI